MRLSMDRRIFIIGFCSSLLLIGAKVVADDTMDAARFIRDGDSLVSAGGSFALGLFSPRTSSNRYLGVWYNNIPEKTVVWVANWEIPLTDTSGVLKLNSQGVLDLINQNGRIVWSSNFSRPARNPVAQLLDSGNLIVKDNESGSNLWQSFDYPSDTLLPEMKIGWDLETGHEWYISNWKTADNDLSAGNFSCRLHRSGYPEMMIWKDSTIKSRLGPWDGLSFSGTPPQLKSNPIYNYEVVLNEKEIYYTFHLTNSSVPSRLVINQNGIVQRFVWVNPTGWKVLIILLVDNCDRYALCGAYGTCNPNYSPGCYCLDGFVPKVQTDWDSENFSSGCVRKSALNCSTDGFRNYSGVKLPETRKSWFNKSLNILECRNMCTKNCSCTAYTNLNIREGGSGCLLWFDDLIDIRQYESGQDIYIRMPASELENHEDMKIKSGSNLKKQVGIAVGCVVSVGILLLAIYVGRKKLQNHRKRSAIIRSTSIDKDQQEDVDLPLFDLGTISHATENFCFNNKLGEGGFGTVYWGKLKDGQEIAVKRLSKDSRQGLDEFKNEVVHIAKLQHRNLVKLLGCCIDEDEKILVYEFMPNKSLDFFIFENREKKESVLLNWPKRYNIINGIARGLLYLHQDSRLRIIHRDLKVSNILLDSEMNPKISDFGLARSFGGNESRANTNKVVGTYGYMPPEYAIDGHYSTKSDVFSFGVMVLEIVAGKRNRGFRHPEHQLNLLGHAWKLFTEGRSLELTAKSIAESCVQSQVLRAIHVGLLCVQRSPEDRPSMSVVVLMLGSDDALPQPKQPGFFSERDLVEADSSSSSIQKKPLFSSNEVTITLLDAR